MHVRIVNNDAHAVRENRRFAIGYEPHLEEDPRPTLAGFFPSFFRDLRIRLAIWKIYLGDSPNLILSRGKKDPFEENDVLSKIKRYLSRSRFSLGMKTLNLSRSSAFVEVATWLPGFLKNAEQWVLQLASVLAIAAGPAASTFFLTSGLTEGRGSPPPDRVGVTQEQRLVARRKPGLHVVPAAPHRRRRV